MTKGEEKVIPPHFFPSPFFSDGRFCSLPCCRGNGGQQRHAQDASGVMAAAVTKGEHGGLAGSGSVLAGGSKSLHL